MGPGGWQNDEVGGEGAGGDVLVDEALAYPKANSAAEKKSQLVRWDEEVRGEWDGGEGRGVWGGGLKGEAHSSLPVRTSDENEKLFLGRDSLPWCALRFGGVRSHLWRPLGCFSRETSLQTVGVVCEVLTAKKQNVRFVKPRDLQVLRTAYRVPIIQYPTLSTCTLLALSHRPPRHGTRDRDNNTPLLSISSDSSCNLSTLYFVRACPITLYYLIFMNDGWIYSWRFLST